jgi:RimJ/RimL family protein N-acetyltransferase
LIGRITLRDQHRDSAMVGLILHPDYAHRGFGSEALNIFCDYAFRQLGLALLRLEVAADNAAARQCYEKCGFTYFTERERNGYSYAQYARLKLVIGATA